MKLSWEDDRPASPHKLLNAYIKRLTGFVPLDGDTTILEEEADIGEVDIATFQWNNIEKSKSHHSVGERQLILL